MLPVAFAFTFFLATGFFVGASFFFATTFLPRTDFLALAAFFAFFGARFLGAMAPVYHRIILRTIQSKRESP